MVLRTAPFQRKPLARVIQTFDARQERRELAQKAQAAILRQEALIWQRWSDNERRQIQAAGRHPVIYPKRMVEDVSHFASPAKWMPELERRWCNAKELHGLVVSVEKFKIKGVDP